MKTQTTFAFLIISVGLCLGQKNIQKTEEYLRHVGDIAYDKQWDDSDFQLCFADSLVYQYFNMSTGLQFQGEKIEIDNYFKKYYKPVKTAQSGWVRIRFIVNCKGQTGRYRVLEADEKFAEVSFDEKVSTQLLNLTKQLTGWKSIQREDGTPIDYYQYLSFKIEDGRISKVLP